MVDWDRAVVRADVPVGSSLVLRVRTGSTAKPDATWSSWSRVPARGRISGSSRYIQYKLELVSPIGIASPSVQAIGFSSNGNLKDDAREDR